MQRKLAEIHNLLGSSCSEEHVLEQAPWIMI